MKYVTASSVVSERSGPASLRPAALVVVAAAAPAGGSASGAWRGRASGRSAQRTGRLASVAALISAIAWSCDVVGTPFSATITSPTRRPQR